MLLHELMEHVNDNTVVEIFCCNTGDRIATYDGKDSIPECYNGMPITDVFTGVSGNTPTLCIEIDTY